MSDIQLGRYINNVKVTPIKLKNVDPRPPLHYPLFPYQYLSVGIVGTTGAGKTTIIKEILFRSVKAETRIFIFSSTAFDEDWQAIKEALEKRGNEVTIFSSIKDEEGNHLRDIIDEYKAEHTQEDEEEQEETPEDKKAKQELANLKHLKRLFPEFLSEEEKETKKKKKKSKFCDLDLELVFDDVSDELKSKLVATFIKKARHYKCLNICAFHNIYDLAKGGRQNLRVLLLLNGMDEEKLEALYKLLELNCGVEAFKAMYEFATTSIQYGFFYVDVRNKFRRNFDFELDVRIFKNLVKNDDEIKI